MALTLTSIHRYPVKSMRGTDLDVSEVEPWGLVGDRRWLVVEADPASAGRFLTARKDPWLATIDVTLRRDGTLLLQSLAADSLTVALPTPQASTEHIDVTVWSSTVPAATADPDVDAWLSELAKRPVRLVHMDDPTLRPTDPTYSTPADRVSFADGYPLLLTTESSLRALGDRIVEDSEGAEEPVTMNRFRPNVVVDGDTPWAEDDWRRVRIGDLTFRAVKGCARCVMTTVDPATGEKGREPLRTLARTRRFDSGAWFGINLVPDLEDGADATEAGRNLSIRVGDPVEVLDAVTPGAGPLR